MTNQNDPVETTENTLPAKQPDSATGQEGALNDGLLTEDRPEGCARVRWEESRRTRSITNGNFFNQTLDHAFGSEELRKLTQPGKSLASAKHDGDTWQVSNGDFVSIPHPPKDGAHE